jgi:hypothetical protein
MSGNNGADTHGWASPRLRDFLERAEKRPKVLRPLELRDFDAELDGQTFQVWVNAPSALRQAFSELNEYSGAAFYGAMAEYLRREDGTPFGGAALQDLFDAWSDALRFFVVARVFEALTQFRDEQVSFFASLPTSGATSLEIADSMPPT